MRPALCLLCIITLFAPPLHAQTTLPATVPTSQPIPRQTLETMYRAELGPLYNPDLSDALYTSHQLIEQYFATPASDQRKLLAKHIEGLGIDANILGRITRIRLDWPAIDPGVYYINERVGPHNAFYFLGIPKNLRPHPRLATCG